MTFPTDILFISTTRIYGFLAVDGLASAYYMILSPLMILQTNISYHLSPGRLLIDRRGTRYALLGEMFSPMPPFSFLQHFTSFPLDVLHGSVCLVSELDRARGPVWILNPKDLFTYYNGAKS